MNLLLGLLRNSKASLVKRSLSSEMQDDYSIYVMGASALFAVYRTRKHWPVELIALFLHDSLGIFTLTLRIPKHNAISFFRTTPLGRSFLCGIVLQQLALLGCIIEWGSIRSGSTVLRSIAIHFGNGSSYFIGWIIGRRSFGRRIRNV